MPETSTHSLEDRIAEQLAQLDQTHALRVLPELGEGIDFVSNDYLSLSQTEYSERGLSAGSTGSRLLSGNHQEVQELEEFLATTFVAQTATFFPNGYMANLGLLGCIAERHDTLILDQHCHASLIDGSRMSLARSFKFEHNSCEDLETKLQNAEGCKIVVVESVYSMDGSEAPLDDILSICEKYNANLIIDDAHSCGVDGNRGLGAGVERLAHPNVIAVTSAFGKAAGSHGAAIFGGKTIKSLLVNKSRPFIFSTAPSPSHCIVVQNQILSLKHAREARKTLRKVVSEFKTLADQSEMDWLMSNTWIQSLLVAGNENVMALANHLRDHNINALPIRHPSVAKGEERIRFTLHAHNSAEDVKHLFKTLESWHSPS